MTLLYIDPLTITKILFDVLEGVIEAVKPVSTYVAEEVLCVVLYVVETTCTTWPGIIGVPVPAASTILSTFSIEAIYTTVRLPLTVSVTLVSIVSGPVAIALSPDAMVTLLVSV